MQKVDETELYRLCDLLGSMDSKLPADAPQREALKKAAIALHSVFLSGKRNDLERQNDELDAPLSDDQTAHLRSMGLNVDY